MMQRNQITSLRDRELQLENERELLWPREAEVREEKEALFRSIVKEEELLREGEWQLDVEREQPFLRAEEDDFPELVRLNRLLGSIDSGVSLTLLVDNNDRYLDTDLHSHDGTMYIHPREPGILHDLIKEYRLRIVLCGDLTRKMGNLEDALRTIREVVLLVMECTTITE